MTNEPKEATGREEFWEDAEARKSVFQLRVSRFPGAFFMHSNVILRAIDSVDIPQRQWWKGLSNVKDILDPDRLRTKIKEEAFRYTKEQNEQLLVHFQQMEETGARAKGETPKTLTKDDILQHDSPFGIDPQIEFFVYEKVYAKPGIDWLVCPRTTCGRVYTLKEASPSFVCKEDGERLQQIAHLFVHPLCGDIENMIPDKGPLSCPQCHKPMRLYLHYKDMNRSNWWCADGHPRVPRDIYRNCPSCGGKYGAGLSFDPDKPVEEGIFRMALIPARTVYRGCTLSTVDMPKANERSVIDEWFGGGMDRAEIMKEIAPSVQAALKDQPEAMEAIIRQIREEKAGKSPAEVTPPPNVVHEIRDYAGALLAKPIKIDALTGKKSLEEEIRKQYGLQIRMLQENLAVVNATFGALVGGSDPAQANFRPFKMHAERYGVLAERMESEALLIELIPERVIQWLRPRQPIESGLAILGDERSFRKHILLADPYDSIFQKVLTLLHTISHLLVRGSDRNSGISRDNLQEILWPRAMAFVLFDHSGSDLGMLRTSFEGSMLDWLAGARYDVENCPNDPLCANDQTHACHGCLYLAERSCTTYWNRHLDRAMLVNLQPEIPYRGYWE